MSIGGIVLGLAVAAAGGGGNAPAQPVLAAAARDMTAVAAFSLAPGGVAAVAPQPAPGRTALPSPRLPHELPEMSASDEVPQAEILVPTGRHSQVKVIPAVVRFSLNF